jgi:hypothetical protein
LWASSTTCSNDICEGVPATVSGRRVTVRPPLTLVVWFLSERAGILTVGVAIGMLRVRPPMGSVSGSIFSIRDERGRHQESAVRVADARASSLPTALVTLSDLLTTGSASFFSIASCLVAMASILSLIDLTIEAVSVAMMRVPLRGWWEKERTRKEQDLCPVTPRSAMPRRVTGP